MRKFLIHSVLFLVLVSGSITFVFFQADGYTDPFYARFTTPKQSSLIIGTSKAAQGIRPDVLNKILPDSIYNFAFTIAHSPFGPAYLNGVKCKLSEVTKDGIFIVAVDTWSISDAHDDPNDENLFDENRSFLNNLTTVSSNPNIPYLLTYYKNGFAKIFDRDSVAFLHDDGWLEINIKVDPKTVDIRIQNKAASLEEKKNRFQLSETRLSYLYKTITYLKERGEVFVVSLPVHPKLTQIEMAVVPEFTELMNKLSRETYVPYLNLMEENEGYTYTDGVHLYRDSAKEVSERIGKWIKLESRRK
ncbi:MAG: hypothetical protein JKY22_03535 [Flavobacteriaceae bacterium]|nr:hypothetical protein [Flavobacteriaceae bacterium]